MELQKQNQARLRNWQKFKLTGIVFDHRCYTESELLIVREIEERIKILKGFWDLETEKIVGHSLKPYKCYSCGRRSVKEYLLDGYPLGLPINLCKKHFKQWSE